jgi:hypothetical protein
MTDTESPITPADSLPKPARSHPAHLLARGNH